MFILISNFNFWYFNVRKWVLLFSHRILEMIRLFNSKRNEFWLIKPYIFGKYSLRAFQQCVKQWLYSIYIGSYSNDLFFQVHLHSSISSNEKMPEIWKKVFLVYLYCTFNRYILLTGNLNFSFFFFFSCLNELVCSIYISFIWKLLNVTANILNKKSFVASIGGIKRVAFL